MRFSRQLLLAYASTAAALCPMAELSRRGLAPKDMEAAYLQGRGLGTPGVKRQSDSPPVADPVSGVLSPERLGTLTPRLKRQSDDPPLLDPLSEVLSPLGLGSLTPRSPRSEQHKRDIEHHVRSRLEERDEDVNVDAPILTPKAHKRHVEERGLVGGLLAPLTGVLSALDIPTPQGSGLKAIPGNDPAHQ